MKKLRYKKDLPAKYRTHKDHFTGSKVDILELIKYKQ